MLRISGQTFWTLLGRPGFRRPEQDVLGASKAGLYNVLITARRADAYVASKPAEDLQVECQQIPIAPVSGVPPAP